jgi:hypothetical protein
MTYDASEGKDKNEDIKPDKGQSFSKKVTGHRSKIFLSIAVAAGVALLVFAASDFQYSEAKKPTTAITGDPTQGYNIHVAVGRHDSANLNAHMDHYCKLDDRIVAVCQLYATTNNVNGGGPQLAQIEFIITDEDYLKLPVRERPNWHNHAVELTPERGSPTCVELPPGLECSALVGILQHTYGKVITIWDPSDGLPNYPPYVFLVDSPFALQQDTNDQLQKEWAVGNSTVSSAGELPNCGIQQAGPCHP